MKALKAGPPTFKLLPPIARTYVVVVVATGAMCLMAAAIDLRFEARGTVRVASGACDGHVGRQD